MIIEDQIRQYITYNIIFSENSLKYDDHDSFVQKGIIDSVGVLELVAFIDETFGVIADEQEIIPDNFDSVSKLANYLRSKLQKMDSRL